VHDRWIQDVEMKYAQNRHLPVRALWREVEKSVSAI
jgi:hypothetical protein